MQRPWESIAAEPDELLLALRDRLRVAVEHMEYRQQNPDHVSPWQGHYDDEVARLARVIRDLCAAIKDLR